MVGKIFKIYPFPFSLNANYSDAFQKKVKINNKNNNYYKKKIKRTDASLA